MKQYACVVRFLYLIVSYSCIMSQIGTPNTWSHPPARSSVENRATDVVDGVGRIGRRSTLVVEVKET